MRKILTFSMLLISTLASAQCPTMTCTSPVQLPITNSNDYNNTQGIYASAGVNRCIQGTGTFGNNLNEINGWTKWSFKAMGGPITVAQTVNINTGKKVFTGGAVTMSQVTFAGGNDSACIYVADYGTLTMTVSAANNTHNYVFLGTGASVIINGISRTAGQIVPITDNPTNVIKIVSGCGMNTPLPITFKYFDITGRVANWGVEFENNFQRVELQHSPDGFEWSTIYTTGVAEGKFQVYLTGQYRLKIDNHYSEVRTYKNENETYKTFVSQDIYDYMGNSLKETPKNKNYNQGGKGHRIIE